MTRSTAEAALARCLWRGTRHFHGKQGATRALTTTVVVSEVHSLATCSTSTACEIKQRIQTSGERAHAGSDLVRNAGTALAEVVSPIQGVSALMEAISHASATDQRHAGRHPGHRAQGRDLRNRTPRWWKKAPQPQAA